MDLISGKCSMDPISMIELSPIDILTLAALSICKGQRSQLSH